MYMYVVVQRYLLFLTFSVLLVANPKKTTLHGGHSRSWSSEQGKKKQGKSMVYQVCMYGQHCCNHFTFFCLRGCTTENVNASKHSEHRIKALFVGGSIE